MYGFKKKACNFTETNIGLLDSQSSFQVKEAYNNLATNVIYAPIEDNTKKIAITSANYDEGKTSVAINLAIALASSLIDKKILLVDADFRLPSIKAYLKDVVPQSNNDSGLTEYLSGNADVCSINSTHIENLDVIYSGEGTINPAGLINSNKMVDLLSSFDGKYDYVIIDTPPVNVVSDSILLLGRVNGYILSTKAKTSTIPSVSAAAESLNMVGANVLGIVLTESN